MPTALRFLLDQGFPQPKLAVAELQANVEFEHLSDHAPELSNASTPDWMVYLAAEAGGFDGVVTQDFRQVAQQEELIALTHLNLSVITWKEGISDSVTAWAMVVAYSPSIVKAIESFKHSIFLLPSPRLLLKDNVLKASDRARELASKEWRLSYSEASSQSISIMKAELKNRDRLELAGPLGRKRRALRPLRDMSPRKEHPPPREGSPEVAPSLFPKGNGTK
jgi:hypothetical protein